MIVKTEAINDHEGVTLTSYIHDLSDEMQTVHQRPAILIMPGGGYEFCSEREGEPIALAYLAKGFNAFVLKYSIKEHAVFPRPLEDAIDALTFIKKQAKHFHIYSNKIAVIGFSAGAHLASMLATKAMVRPNAVILGYPAVVKDAPDWDFETPVVDALTPEMFVFHTFEDNVVPVRDALYIVNALNDAKIPVEFHLFRSGVHGLSLGTKNVSNGINAMVNERFQAWFELSYSWLVEVLKINS